MADGSIVIDTKLDNSGFKSGSTQMKNAVDSLINSVNQFGRTAAQNVESVAPALRNVAGEVSNLSNTMSAAEFQSSMAQMGDSCTNLQNEVDSLRARMQQGFNSREEADQWQADLQKVCARAEVLQGKITELGQARVKSEGLIELEKEAQRLETALFKLYEKRDDMQALGVDPATRSWKALELQIQKTEEALERTEREIAAASAAGGGGYTAGGGAAGFGQMQAGLNGALSSLEELSGRTVSFHSTTERTGAAAKAFGSILKSVGSAAGSLMSSLARFPFKALQAGVNGAKKAFSGLFKSTNKSNGAVGMLAKSLTSVKRLLLTRIKRMFITAIFNSVRASIQNLAKYSSQFNQAMSSMKNATAGLGGNIAVTFGNLVNAVAPALSTLINWLSTAITYLNSFFALISGKTTVTVAKKQTDDYAKSLKSAGGAAKDLVFGFDELNKPSGSGGGGGSSSSGVSYEDKDIADYLPSAVMDMFDKLREAFASQQWEEVGSLVAQSLNSIITAADDWIVNKLQPAAIEWSSRIARILNGLVKDADFSAIGKLFADGLNTIFRAGYTFLSTFDWKELGRKLGEGLNSLFKNTDWETIGKFFASKLNVIINTGAELFKTLKWEEVGSDLAKGVNSWFKEIHWDELTDGLTAGVGGIVDALYIFIKQIEWDNIANTFVTQINRLISDIDWEKLVFTLTLGAYKLILTVYTVLAGINWAELGKSLGDGLNRVFTNGHGAEIDWGELGKKFGDAIKGIIDGIDSFLQTVNWSDVGRAIGDELGNIDWLGIATRLIGLLWDALWAAADYVGGLTERLIELIFGTKEDIQVPDLFTSDVEEQLKTQAGEAGEQTARAMYDGFVGAVNNGTPDAQQAVITSAAMIGLGYQDEMYDWLKGGDWDSEMALLYSQKANDIFGAVTLDGATVDSIKAAFSSAGIEVSNGFAEAIQGTGAQNIAAALALLGAGVNQETIAALDMSNLHTNLMAYMNESGKSLETVASELANNTGEALGKLLPEGMNKGFKAGEKNLKKAVKSIENIASTVESRGQILKDAAQTGKDTPGQVGKAMEENTSGTEAGALAVVNSIMGQFETLSPQVDTEMSDVKKSVEDPLKELPETVRPYADSIMVAVTEAIAKGNPTAVAAMHAAADAIVKEAAAILSDAKGQEIVNAFTTGMKTGIDNKSSVLSQAARSVGDAVVSTLRGIVTADVGYSIGSNLAQGMANGIKTSQAASAAVAAVKNVANTIISTAKSVFKINSPSKVFAEIGSYNMEGLSEGMNGQRGNLLSTMNAIAESLIDSGAFSVPNIAAGRAIPYSARIADADASDNGSTMADFVSNFDETMSNQEDILQRILDALIRKRFTVDEDSLIRAVTNGQRAHERAFGGV